MKWAIQKHWTQENRDTVAVFGNRMSLRQWGRQRMALHFEDKNSAKARTQSGKIRKRIIIECILCQLFPIEFYPFKSVELT